MRCLALVATVVACSFTPGKYRGDGAVPDDVRDDAVDAIPDGADACVAASAECIGNTLRTCADVGAMPQDRVCGWGCDTMGGAHCSQIVPAANAAVVTDLDPDPLLADVTLGNGINIDTGNGKIGTIAMAGSVRPMGTGVMNGIGFETHNTIGVMRVKSFKITASMADPLRFQFTNPIAIVADGPIEIAGYIEVRGLCATAAGGAGGFSGGTGAGNGLGPGGGPGAGTGTGGENVGASGGSHGGVGGLGATAVVGTFNMPSVGYDDDPIVTLRGGSGGGGGGAGGAAFGGSGGGAIQLISNTSITITSGGINAGGCGGQSQGGGKDGGGGGGAGGTILLEAPRVTIAAGAALAVNGGGGGGGDVNGGAVGGVAEAGSLSRTPAAGTPGGMGGDGGDGGAGANIDGENGSAVAGKPGGGGGGAVGRIRINTLQGMGLMIDGAAILSPGADDKGFGAGDATLQ